MVPAPDAFALQREAEAKRDVYLTLPWLNEEEGQGKGGAAVAGVAAATGAPLAPPSSSLAEEQGGAGESVTAGVTPLPRVWIVDGGASLLVLEEVRGPPVLSHKCTPSALHRPMHPTSPDDDDRRSARRRCGPRRRGGRGGGRR